jgi:hypothetical protein
MGNPTDRASSMAMRLPPFWETEIVHVVLNEVVVVVVWWQRVRRGGYQKKFAT